LQQSANLFFDQVNGRVGINTSSPSFPLDVNGTGRFQGALTMATEVWNGFGSYGMASFSGSLYFKTNGIMSFQTSNGLDRMVMSSNGNVLINTTTDAGYKLDVNGSAIIRNTAQVIGSDNENVFTVSWGGSNSVSLGSNTANGPTLRLGSIRITAHPGGSNLSFSNGFLTTVNAGVNTNSPMTIAPYVTGASTGNVVLLSSGARISAHRHQPTSGTLNMVMVGGASANQFMDFAPSSGNAEFNQLNILNQINTTGTYSGIVRGLYYNPILTSITGVNHRAIETTTGNVIFNGGNVGIGTSSPSAPLHIETSALTTALYINTGNDGGFTAQNNGALATNRTTQVRLANGNTLFGTNDRTYQLVNIGKSTTTADFYFQYWDGASYNERLRIFSSGNVSIGTSTDAGYKLDVNGTARFVAPNTYAITYDINGNFNAAGAYSNFSLTNAAGSLRAKLNNDGPNGTLTLYQNATGYIFLNGAQSGNNSYIATALSIGNQSAANASSILELTSTTKGFLPPRMTQAQRNAISSPAIGLEIYQTDATEGKYIYKSSGWTYIG
jgi:hypothetical protein